MSTSTRAPDSTAPSATAAPADPRPGAGESLPLRAFLVRYTGTLLPLSAVLVLVSLVGRLLADRAEVPGWPVAVAAAGGWALAVTAWLRRRGWGASLLAAVVAGPVALLAGSAAAGWLAPSGLLLWGPVSTLIAVALALAAQPMPRTADGRAAAAGTDEGPGQRTDQGLHRWGE